MRFPFVVLSVAVLGAGVLTSKSSASRGATSWQGIFTYNDSPKKSGPLYDGECWGLERQDSGDIDCEASNSGQGSVKVTFRWKSCVRKRAVPKRGFYTLACEESCAEKADPKCVKLFVGVSWGL